MRSHIGRIVVFIALSLCLVGAVGADAQIAETWKVAVGGGRITGYMGVLSHHGLPREYLTRDELADIEVLRRYRVVIVTATGHDQAILNAVEQYVSEGGIAITESRLAPPESVVPGKRLGPDRAPNIDFRGYDHPISRAMQSAGIVKTYARPGVAIIPPSDADNVTVLAEYTDEGVPEKYRGKLTGGKSGIPGALLIEHGKGAWLYFGPRVAFSLALRGPEMQPAILTALRTLTDGTLVERFVSLDADRRLVPKVQWHPETEEVMPRAAPRDAEPTDLPEGLEPMDLPEDAPADYVITGTLVADADATVMLPWFNDNWHHRLEIDGARLRLVQVSNGREQVVAEVTHESAAVGGRIDIRRRPRSLTVFIDGRAVLTGALDPLAGTRGVRGVNDAFLQTCAPVVFTDDFMRAEADPNPWETPAGSWNVFQVEGEPGQGANPFAFRAESADTATAASGYWFWDDYDVGASVRPNCRTASIMAHRVAEDDYLELRLVMPAEGEGDDATVKLLKRTPEGESVLASAAVRAARDRWHRLRLRVSRGHAIAGLSGRQLFHVADQTLRGRGQIGLIATGGSAFFDDVRVEPWQAAPLPMDGGAWLVERGEAATDGGEVTLKPMGSARALAPITELANLQAAAKVRRGDADSAGLLVRYQGPGDYYLLAVHADQSGGSELRVIRNRRGERTVLATHALPGGPDRWHDVIATLRSNRIYITVDGTSLQVADDAIRNGGFGLICEGGAARFRNVTCWPVEHEQYRTDPETPSYAGIIDRHTWAGAGSGWEPAPDDLDLFWHRGMYVSDVEVRVGVHRTDAGVAAATLLAGDGVDPNSGYALSAEQPSPTDPVTVTLSRAGEQVASAQARCWSADGWALGLARAGSLVVGHLDGEVVCSFRDSSPLTGMRRVGFRIDDAVIDPADAEVVSSAVGTWTFEEAPADWRVESGTWEISNRWSCSPEWTWLAGWNQRGRALIHSRERFTGDQVIDIYVGAKMMPKLEGKGHYEELRDLHFGLCGDGEGGGYHVVLGDNNGSGARLLRNGKTVATNSSYSVPQSERHNNWLLVTLVKTGPELSVRVWDNEVLSYTDDDPLESGSVGFGTSENGVIVPRITVYGERLGAGPRTSVLTDAGG